MIFNYFFFVLQGFQSQIAQLIESIYELFLLFNKLFASFLPFQKQLLSATRFRNFPFLVNVAFNPLFVSVLKVCNSLSSSFAV